MTNEQPPFTPQPPVPPAYGASASGAPDPAAAQYGAPESGPYAQPPLDGPPNNIGWAVAALVCFWPLAFHAFGAATRVDRAWLSGRPELALQESLRARKLGQISLWIFLGLFILYFVFILAFSLLPLLFVMIGLGSQGYNS
ncbi:CD225/dispanin family protein [Microbacteriaceae bacterium VKM Ac-2855]|nr:CD225/dispanin family protein [Microbacteriaceae bacterium VKM Ac-2855]